MPLHTVTPLLESTPLSNATGRKVWLKLEALQPPGSFKIRGVGLACETHAQAGKRRFVSSSGGNAGIAVAYAGQKLGVPVVVVVPSTTSAHAQAAIQSYGAELIVHGSVWDEANARAQSMLTEQDAFIHPFDDALLWQGHASMIDEVAASGFRPDAIVLSVGGGGLLAGVVQGLRRNHWHHIPIITAETAGADAFAQSIGAAQPVVLETISSVATSLGAKKVCAQAFQCAQTHPVHAEVVSDSAAVKACLHFLNDHRMLVEPACGASLALAYQQAEMLGRYESLLFIVCGGTVTSLEELQRLHNALS